MDTPILHPTQQCTKCGELKPATPEFFHIQPSGKQTPKAMCLECRKETQKQYRDANKEKRAASFKRWYEDNKKQDAERKKRYREDNREKISESRRRYREANRDRLIAELKAWRAGKSEHRKEYRLRYREANRTAISIYNKRRYDADPKRSSDYHKAHPEVLNSYKQRRRAKLKQLPAVYSHKDWLYALDYFNGRCAVCGRQLNDLFGTHTAAMDHWIPLSSPDCPGTIPTNIVPLCHGEGGCNNHKSARDPIEFVTTTYGKRRAKEILARLQTYFDHVSKDAS